MTEYKLVPVEPTREMINAGYAAMRKNASGERLLGMTAECGIYNAMIAAAPSPAWVPVSERLPTWEDADESNQVWYADCGEVDHVRFDAMMEVLTAAAYWMPKPRVTPPEPPK